MSEVKAVIRKAIMRHAGLSEFDGEAVDAEVEAILKALKKQGFIISKKDMFDASEVMKAMLGQGK